MNWWDEIRKLQRQEIKIEIQLAEHGCQLFRDIQQSQIDELKRQIRLNRALHHSHEEHIQRLKRGFNPHMN